ncbi:sushi, von Willebrand factor type A, EGF and pentraxin domain-containing protein 1-like [Dysidea avara]|uniref:sushi, von Willebrand factor type A, EGF and pentraxin domain-containing protein 1-like n=1 Tax=Dysidea avara TaxID=196820 RepID=UPI00332623F2
MDTIYHCANQPVAVSGNKMSECLNRRRIVPATPICYHNEWITSVMQDNKDACASPTDAPIPTDKPSDDPTPGLPTPTNAATNESAPTSTPDESTLTDAPTSVTSTPSTSTPITYTETPSTVKPLAGIQVVTTPQIVIVPSEVVTPQPNKVTSQSTEAATLQSTEAVTPQPTKAVILQSTEAVTPQSSTEAVTPQPTEAATPQSSTEIVTPQPTEAVTLQPTEAVILQSTEAVGPQPTGPQSTEAAIPKSTEAVRPQPTEDVTPQPTEDITSEPVATSTTPSQTPGDNGCMLMIEYGKATVTHYINDGATLVIEYTCNRGYHFSLNNNKLSRICINGNMPSKPPPCKQIACRPFEPIANGKIEVTGLTYASVAHFICDPGYYITGSAIRSCDTDGEWNGIEGVCKRKCTVPQSIECNDGTRVYPTKSAFADIGDVVQYSVPSRYGLIGDPPVCQPDSTWSAPPNCLKLCDERQNIPNAVVTINRDIKSYTRKITCNEGYQPDGSDVQSCYFGIWTPIFKSCKRGCSDIALANGSTTMMLDNQFALIECDKGFHLDPPLVLISCKEGMWLPSIPTCVPDQ